MVLFLAILPSTSSAQNATGYFEVYCDGVGLFLGKIDGMPAPRELVLFLRVDFPPGLISVPEEKWSEVFVMRKGCRPDGKCEVIAGGKVWLDAEATPAAKRISGKYEINLNEQHLQGKFTAIRHRYKDAPRICE